MGHCIGRVPATYVTGSDKGSISCAFYKFSFLNVHNYESVADIDLLIILTSSCYTVRSYHIIIHMQMHACTHASV